MYIQLQYLAICNNKGVHWKERTEKPVHHQTSTEVEALEEDEREAGLACEVDGVKAIHRTADMCWSGLIQSGRTPCILSHSYPSVRKFLHVRLQFHPNLFYG